MEYNLKILRNQNVLAGYNAAKAVLNAYQYHTVGQPMAVLYQDENNNNKVLFAVGKRDYTNPIIEGSNQRSYGEEFYDIINSTNVSIDEIKWVDLNSGPMGGKTFSVNHFSGSHIELGLSHAQTVLQGGIIFCAADNTIAVVISTAKEPYFEFYGLGGGGTGELEWKTIL